MSILIVLPTFNEAENVERMLHAIHEAFPSADVLVVDDGSPDGTADLAEKVSAELGGIEVLRRGSKSGLGSAYRAGFRVALARKYDVIVEMDTDFSHDPSMLPALVAPIEAGEAELVIGSRYVSGGSTPDWPKKREFLSRTGNRYLRFMLRLPVADATAGFRAYAAPAVANIDLSNLQAGGYVFQVEMADRVFQQGGRIVEIPITFHDRAFGSSKMSSKIVREALWLVTRWGLSRRISAVRGKRTTTSR